MLTLSIDDSMTHDDDDVISENVDCIFILPEIIGPRGVCPERVSGVPDLPEARGKMCAAYDPSGAIIVCGGGPRLVPLSWSFHCHMLTLYCHCQCVFIAIVLPRFWRPSNNCWQLVKAGQRSHTMGHRMN